MGATTGDRHGQEKGPCYTSMARVVVTVAPQEGEREAVAEILEGDVAWLVDGAETTDAEVAMVFWPRQELRDADLAWDDFPALRLIQSATAGVNHIGWSTIPTEVQVAATPGATGEAIAEYVLGAVLEWARGYHRFTEEIKAGIWHLGAPVRKLAGTQVGLLGFGGIGTACARLLSGLGCVVRAINRSGQAEGVDLDHVEALGTLDDLDDLFAWADVLVVAVPLTRDTQGLVGADLLARLAGRGACLVNVSRGAVVDEGALYDWLVADPQHMAVLDVWWTYPPSEEGRPFTRPFHGLPNLLMTPHNSPNVQGYRVRMLREAAKLVRHYLRTGEPKHVQDREAHRLDIEGDGR